MVTDQHFRNETYRYRSFNVGCATYRTKDEAEECRKIDPPLPDVIKENNYATEENWKNRPESKSLVEECENLLTSLRFQKYNSCMGCGLRTRKLSLYTS
jgi:TPP-dependent pyruvate/acetoin dehydrogenase alpha subunit